MVLHSMVAESGLGQSVMSCHLCDISHSGRGLHETMCMEHVICTMHTCCGHVTSCEHSVSKC